jgi:RNA polymerase sigma factor (sigma-70 family)
MYATAKYMLKGENGVVQPHDIVMDAMKSVMTSPPRRVQNWEAFLVTVVKRRALDHFKTSHVKHAAGQPLPDVDLADPLQNTAEDAAEAVDLSRNAATALTLMRDLPDQHQVVLRQRVMEGISLAETAKALGVSGPRVSQLQKEALQTMRDRLTEKGVDL